MEHELLDALHRLERLHRTWSEREQGPMSPSGQTIARQIDMLRARALALGDDLTNGVDRFGIDRRLERMGEQISALEVATRLDSWQSPRQSAPPRSLGRSHSESPTAFVTPTAGTHAQGAVSPPSTSKAHEPERSGLYGMGGSARGLPGEGLSSSAQRRHHELLEAALRGQPACHAAAAPSMRPAVRPAIHSVARPRPVACDSAPLLVHREQDQHGYVEASRQPIRESSRPRPSGSIGERQSAVDIPSEGATPSELAELEDDDESSSQALTSGRARNGGRRASKAKEPAAQAPSRAMLMLAAAACVLLLVAALVAALLVTNASHSKASGGALPVHASSGAGSSAGVGVASAHTTAELPRPEPAAPTAWPLVSVAPMPTAPMPTGLADIDAHRTPWYASEATDLAGSDTRSIISGPLPTSHRRGRAGVRHVVDARTLPD